MEEYVKNTGEKALHDAADSYAQSKIEQAKEITHNASDSIGNIWAKHKHRLKGPASLRAFAFSGGVVIVLLFFIGILGILSFLNKLLNPRDIILDLYILLFGFITIFLECQDVELPFLAKVQPFLAEWFKFTTVVGGRGAFYILLGIMDTMNTTWFDVAAGVYMIVLGVMFILWHIKIHYDVKNESTVHTEEQHRSPFLVEDLSEDIA
eukprot:GHVR01120718.1.p1 GENE.GHVR01120718.1~~GHVR01120718.1.p1  ORF type:complete len:208 (+),score=38.37 GHVR01120718.1:154-777(+)